MALSTQQIAALHKQVTDKNTHFRQAYEAARTQGVGTVFCFSGYYYSAYTVAEYLALSDSQKVDLEKRILDRIKEDHSPLTLLKNWNETRKQWGDSLYGGEAFYSLHESFLDELQTEEFIECEDGEVDAYDHMLAISVEN